MKYPIGAPVSLTVIARSRDAAVEAADAILPEGRRVLASAPSSSSEPRIDPLQGAAGGPVTDILLWAPDLTTPAAFARAVKNLPGEWRGCGARMTVLAVGDLSFTGLLRGGRGVPAHDLAVRLGGDVAIAHGGLVRIERATGVSVRRLRHGASEAVPGSEWSDAVAAGVDRAVTELLSDYPSLLEAPESPENPEWGYAITPLWYGSIASLVGAPVALVAPVVDRVRGIADAVLRPSGGSGAAPKAAGNYRRRAIDFARAAAVAAEVASENVPDPREAHRAADADTAAAPEEVSE